MQVSLLKLGDISQLEGKHGEAGEKCFLACKLNCWVNLGWVEVCVCV